MTHENESDQRPSGTSPWNGKNQPAEPNPFSQAQPRSDSSGRPAQDPGDAQQGTYGQAPAELNPYGQPVRNPYAAPYGQTPSTAPWPHPSPTGAVPTDSYPAWGERPPIGSQPRRRHTAAWIATGAVLVFFLVGGMVGLSLGNAAHAPELQVQAYLDALRDGEAESALAISGTTVDSTDLLLTDEAYGNAEKRITGYTIGDSTVDGETATVTTTISQGGVQYKHDFSLTRAGRDAVVFDRWALDEPDLGAVSVGVSAPEDAVVEVGGVDASSARSGEIVELRALPGTYAVALGGDTTWYTADTTAASVVGFGSDADDAGLLAVTLTDAGTQSATDAVNAWLDDCIASTELAPAGCPFSATNSLNYDISNLVWTVTRPAFSIGEFSNGVWPVETEDEGSAQATADARDPATGETGQIFTDEFAFDIGGAIDGFSDAGASYDPAG